MKSYSSPRSIVPKVTPRKVCERIFTHSSSACTAEASSDAASRSRISSQAALRSSYISELIAPRTVRADSRAALRQLMIDDGLYGSRTRYSSTARADSAGCVA
jgi:hypothetical protein